MRRSKGEYPREKIKIYKTNLLFDKNIKKNENSITLRKSTKKYSLPNVRSTSNEIIKTKITIAPKISSNLISFEKKELSSDNEDDNIIENSFGEEEPIIKPPSNNTKNFFKHKFKEQTFNRSKIIPYNNFKISLKSKSPQYKLTTLRKTKKSKEEKTRVGSIPKFNYNLKNSKYNNSNNNNSERLKKFNFNSKKEDNNIGNYYHCRNCMLLIAENKNSSKFYINN